MAIVVGDQNATKQFLNYALPISRTDFQTGARLGVKHFRLRQPFRTAEIDEGDSLGRTVQGAANGSENILQG